MEVKKIGNIVMEIFFFVVVFFTLNEINGQCLSMSNLHLVLMYPK